MTADRLAQALRDIDTVLRVEGMDLELGSRRLLKEVQGAIREASESIASQSPAEGDEPTCFGVGDVVRIRDCALDVFHGCGQEARDVIEWYHSSLLVEVGVMASVPNVQPKGTQLPEALGEWLTATGELYIAMGRPKFEATEPTLGVVETLREAVKRLAELQTSLDFHKRRCDALQACQSTMRDPERTMVCDILANGSLLINGKGKLAAERYAVQSPAPGTVQLPSPITEEMHDAACKVLTRAHGLDGLPQRMLDAMRAAAPAQCAAVGADVAIGRWGYRGVVADREATGLANKVNAELDGKKVVAFGCESESFAPGHPSQCKWKGWCNNNNCPDTPT